MATFKEISRAIRAALDLEVSSDDMEGLTGKLLRLTNLIGSSAELKAKAKGELKRAELIAYARYKSEKLTPTMMQTVIGGECSQEYENLEYADRLNAGIVHACDSIRTIISLRKEEMKTSSFSQ